MLLILIKLQNLKKHGWLFTTKVKSPLAQELHNNYVLHIKTQQTESVKSPTGRANKVVPRARIELATRGFSVLPSSNRSDPLFFHLVLFKPHLVEGGFLLSSL
ncbi:MAG: hypothetical protein SFU25_04290 [Candidatus Caenarcaniphilales bacterium]|nr:hypothetical protein [Candidatus Caenarcaniphilales bacterium]